jgi:hypothetical protein
MKMKILVLSLCLLALSSTGFAQTKKAIIRSPALSAEQIVRNLYKAHKNEKTSPFTQIKSRAVVDKYFQPDFGDLIFKTNSSETGWNVDPLYNSQDPQITSFVVGRAKEDGHDGQYLRVSFKSYGKPEWVGFSVRRRTDMVWKIDNIEYSDGEDLQAILRYSTDMEYQKLIDGDPFKGSYMVGTKICDVMPTMNGMFHRVTCEGQDSPKLYATEGDEGQTTYIRNDGKVKTIDKFVFKKDKEDGIFIDAAGKEMKVTKAKTSEEPKP